jgi:predicted dehydrogenase
MTKADGMSYAPEAHVDKVCKKGEFPVGVIGLQHGHIYGMCRNLENTGAHISKVYDSEEEKIAAFLETFPNVKPVSCEEEILEDASIRMVATAHVPSMRGPLGLRVLDHEKDFFSDKTPFTTINQLEAAREKVKETGRIWAVSYSERIAVEAAVFAGQLIDDGAIGRVLQVIGLGPHRLAVSSRPDWFFKKKFTGGILCDIGSHQIEQFLSFANAHDAQITGCRVANYHHPDYPELEDYGEANLIADNGATNYFRVDWFTPDGLGIWGDGRTFILGTDGYIELRKYIDVARDAGSDHVYLVDHRGEKYFNVQGKVGFPYFSALVRDCLDRTETAMTQAHTFKAAELCLQAQAMAERIGEWSD